MQENPYTPPHNCALCPRLKNFREEWQKKEPHWFNAPVPTFSAKNDIKVLIVGLAPGLRGANKTGRPFTGDYAGDLLYHTLLKHDFAKGTYEAKQDDDLSLKNCAITNAVRCVPPQNKPTTTEIKQCASFLNKTIEHYKNLKVMIALGKIAHDSIIRSFDHKLSQMPFSHGAQHQITHTLRLIDSYHCSRYNTQTKRLTPEMFYDIFQSAKEIILTLK